MLSAFIFLVLHQLPLGWFNKYHLLFSIYSSVFVKSFLFHYFIRYLTFFHLSPVVKEKQAHPLCVLEKTRVSFCIPL